MKLIITGSKVFEDYKFLSAKMDFLLSRTTEEITIISGAADGADRLGEQYAQERGYELVRIPADRNRYGRKAAFVRNQKMAEAATHCVVFNVDKSKDSINMIETAKQKGLKLKVYNFATHDGRIFYLDKSFYSKRSMSCCP